MKKRLLSLGLALALCLTLLPAAALAASPGYLALGDSITTGYAPGGTVERPFANQVAGEKYTLTNQAANGETTATLLAKLEEGTLSVAGASLITLTIGGNDLMGALYQYLADAYNGQNGTGLTAGQIQASLMGSEGAPVDQLYGEMMAAYDRLSQRLHPGEEEDEDVEVFFTNALAMCEYIGLKMYRYGDYYARHPEQFPQKGA